MGEKNNILRCLVLSRSPSTVLCQIKAAVRNRHGKHGTKR